MQELLEQVRYDGEKYWMKQLQGSWIQVKKHMARRQIQLIRNLPRNEASALCEQLKFASREVADQPWWEEVRWHNFIEGLDLIKFGDRINFCFQRSGRLKKAMTLHDFNQLLRDDFPSNLKSPKKRETGCC